MKNGFRIVAKIDRDGAMYYVIVVQKKNRKRKKYLPALEIDHAEFMYGKRLN